MLNLGTSITKDLLLSINVLNGSFTQCGQRPRNYCRSAGGAMCRALWYVESFQVPQTYSQVKGTNRDGTETRDWDMYQNVCHVLQQKTLLLSYISHNLQHIIYLGKRAYMATIQNEKWDTCMELRETPCPNWSTIHCTLLKRSGEWGTIWYFYPITNFLTNFNEDQIVVTLRVLQCLEDVFFFVYSWLIHIFLINTRLFSSLHFQRTLSESSQRYSTCILVKHPAWDAGLGLVITLWKLVVETSDPQITTSSPWE